MCKRCNNKGFYAVQYGADDFDEIWCECEAGEKAREEDEKQQEREEHGVPVA